MVASILLWKLLHCKRLKRKKYSGDRETKKEDNYNVSEVIVKKEVDEYNRLTLCRVCLKDGNVPIFENTCLENIVETLNIIGGIDVRPDDNFPKYLCQSCLALLQGAILLRKTAQESDLVLKQPSSDTTLADNVDILGGEVDSSFEYEKETKKEIDMKTEKKHKRYHCKRCTMDFESFKEYNEHRMSKEHENMRHTCSICNKTYSSLYFKRHMALHKLDTSYMCDICGKKFVIKGQFTRHRVTHFYNLPFKCSLCPYRGRFTESLKMHMRSHTGEKPYQCSQCPSRFVSKSNLNKHMLTHKGGFDFRCDPCGRGFYTQRAIDLHFKVDHIGIKDHICNICGKEFGYRRQMMKHQLKVHKREKVSYRRMPLYLQVESDIHEVST